MTWNISLNYQYRDFPVGPAAPTDDGHDKSHGAALTQSHRGSEPGKLGTPSGAWVRGCVGAFRTGVGVAAKGEGNVTSTN